MQKGRLSLFTKREGSGSFTHKMFHLQFTFVLHAVHIYYYFLHLLDFDAWYVFLFRKATILTYLLGCTELA